MCLCACMQSAQYYKRLRQLNRDQHTKRCRQLDVCVCSHPLFILLPLRPTTEFMKHVSTRKRQRIQQCGTLPIPKHRELLREQDAAIAKDVAAPQCDRTPEQREAIRQHFMVRLPARMHSVSLSPKPAATEPRASHIGSLRQLTRGLCARVGVYKTWVVL
jgi:hypothetical protein